MAAAAPAIGAAETFKRDRQGRKPLVDRAFAPARKHPGAERPSGQGQLVDMPMGFFLAPHVAGEPRRNAARPPCRAAVDIKAGRERRAARARLDAKRRVQRDQQRIGAAFARRLGGRFDESHHRARSP